MSITVSEARARLFPLLQQVNDDHEPVETASGGGDAVLMSAEDFRSWQETAYLLRSPADAAHLMAAVAADKAAGKTLSRKPVRPIGEIQRDPFTGIGEPEPLKGGLSGYWSRRIEDEHRLVHRATGKEVVITKVRHHY